MKTELEKTIKDEPVAEVINGHWLLFHDFIQKSFYYDSVKRAIFDGIEKFESLECRQAVEQTGLAKMHEHFPADKLFHLDVFLRKHLRQLLIEMTYCFCKEELGLSSTPFFIAPDTFVMKISYPFEVAIKSKVSYAKYLELSNEVEAQSQPFRAKTLLKKLKARAKKLIKGSPPPSQGYHDHYPYAANTYGAHIDSWYGTPLDGINLWWAIAGVTKESGMVLYPETFGRYIPHKPQFGYIAPGNSLPKPHTLEIPDGSVFVFNSDLLHGSHLNISNVTRIAIAPRICLQKPRFNPEAS